LISTFATLQIIKIVDYSNKLRIWEYLLR